jgi:hypothetical protein
LNQYLKQWLFSFVNLASRHGSLKYYFHWQRLAPKHQRL